MGLARRMGTAIGEYWRQLRLDYGTSLKDMVVEARERKVRTLVYASAVAGVVYAVETNPCDEHLDATLVDWRLRTMMVAEGARDWRAERALHDATRAANERRLRVVDCVLFSLAVRAPGADGCDLYADHCKRLRPSWRQRLSDVEDVGAFGRWFGSEARQRQFDVNPDEWPEEQPTGLNAVIARALVSLKSVQRTA